MMSITVLITDVEFISYPLLTYLIDCTQINRNMLYEVTVKKPLQHSNKLGLQEVKIRLITRNILICEREL